MTVVTKLSDEEITMLGLSSEVMVSSDTIITEFIYHFNHPHTPIILRMPRLAVRNHRWMIKIYTPTFIKLNNYLKRPDSIDSVILAYQDGTLYYKPYFVGAPSKFYIFKNVSREQMAVIDKMEEQADYSVGLLSL